MERDRLNTLDDLVENEAIEEYEYKTTLNTHVREEKKLFSRQQLESRKRDSDSAFPEDKHDSDSDNRKRGPKKQYISELKQDNSDKENRDDNAHSGTNLQLNHYNIVISDESLSCGALYLCSNCPEGNDGYYDSNNSTRDISIEIKNLIAKMKNDSRLFEYRIVNLSEKNQADPVNQVFTNNDKKTMKELWKNMEPSFDEKHNTSRKLKWEKNIKPQIRKYTNAIKVKPESIFDDNNNGTSLKVIFEAPFEDEFNYKKHYEIIWVRDIYQRFICLFNSPFNILRDSYTSEMAYRDSFVNPIIPKVFDDVNDKIRFPIGEIESNLCKQYRNQMKGIKPRVYLGSKHDGILKMYVNACEFEIGFLEVVGSPTKVDVKGYYEDLEKLLEVMQISIYYQRCHHLNRNVTEEKLLCIQSFGVLVYQRKTTIYVMHRSKEGLNLVDVLTTFTIPECADQAYVLEEIIKKVYFFKSRIMDYYIKLQDISQEVDTSDSNEDEELLLASIPN